jgi:hypothetical protein
MDDQPVTVRELSQKITAVEQGVCTEHATGEPYRNVYNSLSQTHLSTMAEVGLLEYDQRRQKISPNKGLMTASTIAEINRILYISPVFIDD